MVLKRLLVSEGKKNVIRPAVREELLENFRRLAQEITYPDEEHLQSFLNFVLFRAEEEFLFADTNEALPDPRYVQCMLLELK